MIVSLCYSVFIFLHLCSFSSSSLSHQPVSAESIAEDRWQSDVEENEDFIVHSKRDRASYQHEQSLLADVYSSNRVYVSVQEGRIHPSNFTYYTFRSPGTYRFILISQRGDADLYISTRDKHVSYDNYEFSSCTCGIDEIIIDSYMKRPIYIGIYGYSQYRVSQYRLLIEVIDSQTAVDENHFGSMNEEKTSQNTADDESRRSNVKTSHVVVDGENNPQQSLWSLLGSFLEFLVEVLG